MLRRRVRVPGTQYGATGLDHRKSGDHEWIGDRLVRHGIRLGRNVVEQGPDAPDLAQDVGRWRAGFPAQSCPDWSAFLG